MIELLFGSIISATDPMSVLSIFQEMGVGKRLTQG
jgi:NhaP-type Na+/H+ or K+/H+ antiporter